MNHAHISQECHDVCLDVLVKHCLALGGDHAEQEHVRLMLDCIQICQANADFMRRDSDYAAQVAQACAEVCDACAESCERFDSQQMKRCAEICRKCAEECRGMSRGRKAA